MEPLKTEKTQDAVIQETKSESIKVESPKKTLSPSPLKTGRFSIEGLATFIEVMGTVEEGKDEKFEEDLDEEEASYGSSDEIEEVEPDFKEDEATAYHDTGKEKATNQSIASMLNLQANEAEALSTALLGTTSISLKPSASFNFEDSIANMALQSTIHGDNKLGYAGPDHAEEILPLTNILPAPILKEQELDHVEEEQAGDTYQDPDFTHAANIEASEKALDHPLSWEGISWKHLKELPEGVGPLYKQINPLTIQQGDLGNCYLISALSAISMRPAFIKRLFLSDTISDKEPTAVWLNISGRWTLVKVDSYFPIREDGLFRMASNKSGEHWVGFLEKAYAKAFGSYQLIDGGKEVETMKDLTGAPYEILNAEELENVDAAWRKIATSRNKGYAIVCSIQAPDAPESTEAAQENPQGVSEVKREDGLYEGHAYSLLACAIVPDESKKLHRLVQINNPWGIGSRDWKGDWSKDSQLWTEEARQLTAHQEQADESDTGIIWMTIEDFCKRFTSVGICKLHANFYFNSLDLHFDLKAGQLPPDAKPGQRVGKHTQKALLIDAPSSGKYYFSVDQEDSRFDPTRESHRWVHILIAKVSDDGFKFIGCNYKMQKSTAVKCNIRAGRYLALVDVYSEVDEAATLVFGSYGCDIASLTELNFSDALRATAEHLIWRDWACKESLHWQKMIGSQVQVQIGDNVVKFTVEVADKAQDWGVKIKRLTPEVQIQGLLSSIKIGTSSPILLGQFKSEIEVFKTGTSGCLAKPYYHVEKKASELSKNSIGKTVSQLISNLKSMVVDKQECKIPPAQNPHLQRLAKGAHQ